MKFSVDVNGLNQQRYDAIKKKGEYLELDVLIGMDKEELPDGRRGIMPVVTTAFHGCGPEEMACLYATLKSLIARFEKEYPMECAYANAAMNIQDMGTIQTPAEGHGSTTVELETKEDE